jgi:hypothetical protein
MDSKKKTLLRWLLAAGIGGALIGGGASAMPPEDCYKLYPCGCASDGGTLWCTERVAC